MPYWVKKGLLIFSITLLFLFSIEILSGLLIQSGIFNKNGEVIQRANIYPTEHLEEIKEMFLEQASIKYEWEPFLHQRAQPFNGKHIRINEQLVRKTKQPHFANNKTIKIFAFGGSTMWGDGSRDNFTIPSWLSKMIEYDSLAPFHITNFGNSAYTRTHENILLIRELQKGNIPDIVIFYDGVNDVISCGFHHEVGIPQKAKNRKMEFNVRQDKSKLILMLARSTFTLRLINLMRPKKKFRNLENADISSLSMDFVNHYLQNVKISNALAKEYGFECINYWQPVVYTKENLTTLDERIINEIPYYLPYFKNFYKSILENKTLNSRTDFHNLSHLLDNSTQYYYDLCHISEDGNEVVAAEMYKDLKTLIQAKSKELADTLSKYVKD